CSGYGNNWLADQRLTPEFCPGRPARVGKEDVLVVSRSRRNEGCALFPVGEGVSRGTDWQIANPSYSTRFVDHFFGGASTFGCPPEKPSRWICLSFSTCSGVSSWKISLLACSCSAAIFFCRFSRCLVSFCFCSSLRPNFSASGPKYSSEDA